MQFIEALKSARKLEIFILLAAAAILLVLMLGGDGDSGGNTLEERLERILSSIDGAGRVSVMLMENGEGSCTGAVVSTPAADDISVSLQIQRAVKTLTGLELEQIEIVKSGR
ncbi:MAG: hypothetical protein IJ466_10860 [Clostridia bacterium]|nr:hypothetical protein [Clostridia bacterium]